ncbi:MAG: ABC transporter permease [Parvibaculaceae bacterium]
MTDTAATALAPPRTAPRGLSPAARLWRETWRQREFRFGLILLLTLLAASILVPLLTGIDATKMQVKNKYLPPVFLPGGSFAHILGTDHLGRDLFVRSLIGLQYALGISFTVVILMFLFGSMIGLISGYFGKVVDALLMRLTDAQLSIPLIILAITLLTVSRPTVPLIIFVLAVSGWPVYARVARGVTLSERNKEYVRAAQILGASDWRIILTMIAPNILPPIAFVAVLDLARMMIFEAILGFMSIGVQPPTPTFGNIIADGRKYLINAWWIATMPGVFLLLALLSINLMGASLERARNKLFSGQI